MIEGGYSTGSTIASQLGRFRPIPELTGYRLLLDNLYDCSANLHSGPGIGRGSSYNCYQEIAGALRLEGATVGRVMSEPRLAGKRVIVTGAGRGLGREFALHLADLGAHVLAADINAEALASTCERASERGRELYASTTDVADPEQTRILATTARDVLGGLDALVNNAADRRGPHPPSVRRDRGRGVGPRARGQRQGRVAVREGGGAAAARGRRRLDREHGLGGRVLGLAGPRPLRDLEGGGHRADARARPRARPGPDPGQRARTRVHPDRGKRHDDAGRAIRRLRHPTRPPRASRPTCSGRSPSWSPTRARSSPARRCSSTAGGSAIDARAPMLIRIG